MTSERNPIDIGAPGAWNVDGLVRADAEVIRLARHHAATPHGAETIRWYFLEALTADPAPRPFASLEQMLEDAEDSLAALVFKRLRRRQGHLDDTEVGTVVGYATDYPVKRREWRKARERVFARIGLELGPPPSAAVEQATQLDIGAAPHWRYDVIRVLDRQLIQLAEHHAATDVGARTIRWYVWHELTARPRPVEMVEIERQLENAEASLMASFSNEVRRARGHLGDDEVARMMGFRGPRPVVEGYYRQLREEVFGRIAGGFGAVDLPELRPTPDAVDVGRMGAWKKQSLARIDKEILKLARAYAKTEQGAQTLRWHLLDGITEDPAPVDMMLVDQRLQKLGASVLDLFGIFERRRRSKPFLGDGKVARFAGLDSLDGQPWQGMRTRVLERVEDDIFGP